MGPGRAAFLTVLSAALTALFVWMLSRSFTWPLQGESPIWAGGALFFGAGVLLGLSGLFAARVPPPDIDGSTSIYNSSLRAILLALGCVAVAVGTVLMQPLLATARNVLAHYVVYVVVPGCALAALLQLRTIFDRTSAYRLDATGIKVSKRFVPWSAVTGIGTFKFRSVEHLTLKVTPEYFAKLNALGKLNSFMGVPLLSGATGVRNSALEDLVMEYWKRARA